MDFDNMSVFKAMKKSIAWLGNRQKVLAQNIANADTPDYQPRDLKPLDFKRALADQVRPVAVALTDKAHIKGTVQRAASDFKDEKSRLPYETAPAGNAVVLEEQMVKMNETQLKHRLSTDLYRKHLDMFRIAIGKR
jgi:flagellar basal-body rod protein FlgB